MLKGLSLLLLTVALAWGQTTPNSITVTATRNATLQPDQVVFGVTVSSGLTSTRDEAVAALQGSGITAANFSNVRTVQLYDPRGQGTAKSLEWTFNLPVALSGMKSTIGLLSAVQKSMAQKNDEFSMSFGVQGMQVSSQLQQSQTCSLADLIADARAQASKLASAAGKGAGAVLAMSSATVATDPNTLFGSPAYYPQCSLTVKFGLEGF